MVDFNGCQYFFLYHGMTFFRFFFRYFLLIQTDFPSVHTDIECSSKTATRSHQK